MFWPSILSLLVMWCTGLNSQQVISQPPSASISPGNTVKLSCVMSSGLSISSYHVSWYQQKPGNPPRYLLRYYSDSNKHQGSGVPSRFSASKDTSSNTCYLNIAGALAEDEADYYCATWHSSAFHSSNSQDVISQPPSASVSLGNTVKLSCVMSSGLSISGYAVYWFQQKPGNPPRYLLREVSLIIMLWPAILCLLVMRCTGSNSQDVISQPLAASVSPGNSAKVSCVMSSGSSITGYAVFWFQQKPGNPPRFLLWYRSDSDKYQGSGVPSRFAASKDTSSNTCYLNIAGALAEDEADYYCSVWHNSAWHTTRLITMFWPHILSLLVMWCTGLNSQQVISQPPSGSISPGNTVKLSCVMSSGLSIGSYYVSWYQQKPGSSPRYLLEYYSDSDQHQGSGVPSRFSGSKDTSSNTCYLNIAGALAEDEAEYYCLVWHNSAFHSDSVRW
ncbi:UNVERIFIED_CONTAM: hypothetical protein K2H54_021575 [Gekko kuhli]